MNFELTKEQTLLKKAAQQFAENILEPSAAELDETHTFPVENFKLMARYGFTGIGVPKEYGGVGGGMTGGDRAAAPLSGALFRQALDVRGLPESRFLHLPAR